jgi:hypothetical protein
MTSCLKVLFGVMFILLLAPAARSQRYLAIATSDWSAINSLYLNPANIADCREKISIGLFSLGLTVDNNLFAIPGITDIGNAIGNSDSLLTKSHKKNFSMMAPAVAFRGPGIMISLSKNTSLALTTGIRAINQFNNFDPALYRMFSNDSMLPTGNYKANVQNFNWTAHLWSEVGLTLGTVVSEGYRHRLNFGITVRRLGGIGYLSIAGKNIDLDYDVASDSFTAANADIQFSSNVINDSSAVFKNITPFGLFKKFFGETAGEGLSTDLGFTYRYRIGEAEHSDYMESNQTHDLILSVAMTDFGAIRYYNSTNGLINITGSGVLTSKDLKNNVSSVASVVDYAKRHGFNVDTATKSRVVYLPVALVASADVQVRGRFFVNLLYIANLANRNNFGNSYYNQLTVTPRYDFHKMTVALPVTYSMLARDIKMGFGARYAGFFIGSDDILATFKKDQRGLNFYIGGYVPVFKKHHDPAGLHWGM